MGSAPASPNLASYIAPEELEVTSTQLYQDYFDLPVDVEEGPSSLGNGNASREENHEEYKTKEKPLDDGRGDPAVDDDSDTDFSDLGEGTSLGDPVDPVVPNIDNNVAIEPPEPTPERQKVDREPEGDFDPRDFPTYFADGSLDLKVDRDRNSDNLFVSDSDDEDDDAQDLGHLDHILRDGAPVGLRIREVRPAEGLAEMDGGVGQPNGDGNGVANPPVNDQVDPVAPVQEVNEEIEQNLDDDMEGAMEAIGLRGPVLTVLQNVGIVIWWVVGLKS